MKEWIFLSFIIIAIVGGIVWWNSHGSLVQNYFDANGGLSPTMKAFLPFIYFIGYLFFFIILVVGIRGVMQEMT